MRPVVDRTHRLIAVAVGVVVGSLFLVSCTDSPSFSDELVCGELVLEDGSQVFAPGSCNVEHTAERFFFFESPFETYNSNDIEIASGRYCLQRFHVHYDFNDDKWAESGFEYVGLAPSIEEWDQGNRTIACVAFRSDGSVFP